MDISPPLVANGQPSELANPGEGPFNNPPVLAQSLGRLHPAPGNAGHHSSLSASHSAPGEVIRLVRMQFPRALPRSAPALPDARNAIQNPLEWHRVMLIGRSHQNGQRNAIRIRHQVVLGPVLPTVRRVRPDRFAPLFARMYEASTAARSQSIFPASFNASSRVR